MAKTINQDIDNIISNVSQRIPDLQEGLYL
jgi:hypothetical protein